MTTYLLVYQKRGGHEEQRVHFVVPGCRSAKEAFEAAERDFDLDGCERVYVTDLVDEPHAYAIQRFTVAEREV